MRLRPESREARHKARAGSAESLSATAQAATHEWSPPEHWRRCTIYAVRGVRLQRRGAARVWQQDGDRSTGWRITELSSRLWRVPSLAAPRYRFGSERQ